MAAGRESIPNDMHSATMSIPHWNQFIVLYWTLPGLTSSSNGSCMRVPLFPKSTVVREHLASPAFSDFDDREETGAISTVVALVCFEPC